MQRLGAATFAENRYVSEKGGGNRSNRDGVRFPESLIVQVGTR
jgi:hypothetical protein